MLSLFFFIQANGIIETSRTFSPFDVYLKTLINNEDLSKQNKDLSKQNKKKYPQATFDNFKFDSNILNTLKAWESLFQTFSTNNSLNSEIFSSQEALDEKKPSPIDLMAQEILTELNNNKRTMMEAINNPIKKHLAVPTLLNVFKNYTLVNDAIITTMIKNINDFMKKKIFQQYFPSENNLTYKDKEKKLNINNYFKLEEDDIKKKFIETLRYFTCLYLKINNIDKSTQLSKEEKPLRENLEKILIKNIALFYCLFAQELQTTGK